MAKIAVKKVSDVDFDVPTSGGSTGGSDTSRRKFSISLSKRSAEAFAWLKEATDSDTDSEVVRNALRLHFVLLQRHKEGDEFFVRTAKGGDLVKINLFVDTVAEAE